MMKLLPDSKGSIEKVLFHHTPVYIGRNLVQEGIFKSFLQALNQTGTKPDAFVFATYQTEEERESLALEANTWKNLLKSLEYVEIKTDSLVDSKPPYPQDVGLVLDQNPSSFIISKSPRVNSHQNVMKQLEELLIKAELQPRKFKLEYNLEGGYVYTTSNYIFYSNSQDHQIIKRFEQKGIFVENILGRLSEQLYFVFSGFPSIAPTEHVDLVLSAFENEKSLELFCVDFRETMLSSFLLSNIQRTLLSKHFDKWDQDMKKLLVKINSRVKNVNIHKVPGFIDCKDVPGVYSPTNLLFHSTKKDYAFYLKCPSIVEEEYNQQINKQIEDVLKEINITPIPIAGIYEITNMNHVYNSAGLRCLVKVISRK